MNKLNLIILSLSVASCASLNESLQMGAGFGLATGGAAAYVAHSPSGGHPTLEDVGTGAGIGLALGLITSHFTYRSLEESRKQIQVNQTEMSFGDLPPSPFVFPKRQQSKGSRQ